MEAAFFKELGEESLAIRASGPPTSTGFIEQLDLDLYEAEL
jgi:hypothetical protein